MSAPNKRDHLVEFMRELHSTRVRNAQLRAENARLRAALEQIQKGAASNAGRCMDCNTIQLVAEKALTNSDTDINALFLGGAP